MQSEHRNEMGTFAVNVFCIYVSFNVSTYLFAFCFKICIILHVLWTHILVYISMQNVYFHTGFNWSTTMLYLIFLTVILQLSQLPEAQGAVFRLLVFHPTKTPNLQRCKKWQQSFTAEKLEPENVDDLTIKKNDQNSRFIFSSLNDHQWSWLTIYRQFQYYKELLPIAN